MTGNISDTQKRFSIFVPSPSVSFNMGMPHHDNGFGYKGFTLSASPFMFFDCNKHTLFQAGTHSCWQIGGNWTQYANGNSWINSQGNTIIGSGNHTILSAGAAGTGQVTALTYRPDGLPKLPPYNNVTLQYRVTEQASSLAKLLNGKDDTDMAATRGPKRAAKGLTTTQTKSWTDLDYEYGNEVEDYLKSTDSDKAFGVVKKFAPYKYDTGPKKFFSTLHRTRDVMQNALFAVTDNNLVGLVTAVAGATQKVLDSYAAVARVPAAMGNWGPTDEDNPFAQEFNNGLRARAENMGDAMSDLDERAKGTQQAEVVSGAEPFDLSGCDEGESLTIETDAGWITITAPHWGDRAELTGSTFTSTGFTGSCDLTLEIDGKEMTVSFNSTHQTPQEVADRINSVVGFDCASVDSGRLVLKSVERGSDANVTVVESDWIEIGDDGYFYVHERLGFSAGASADGSGVNPKEVSCSDLTTSGDTVDEVTEDGATMLKVSSLTEGSPSEVKTIDPAGDSALAAALGLAGQSDLVQPVKGGDAFVGGSNDPVMTFRSAMFEINKMPEDLRNMGRPVLEALDDATAALENLYKAYDTMKKALEAFSGDTPPPSMGMFSSGSITMGCSDAMVGVASNGILFNVTGKTGFMDYKKSLLAVEQGIMWALGEANNPFTKPGAMGLDDGPDAPLGFRVKSCSDVELTGTQNVDVSAVGRDMADKGVGVVRIGASKAAELCANTNLALSARGEDGAVEMFGKTLVIGASTLDDAKFKAVTDSDGDKLWRSSSKQQTTENISANATASVGITVGKFHVLVDTSKVSLCVVKDDKSIDTTKPKLELTEKNLKINHNETTVDVKENNILLRTKKDLGIRIDDEMVLLRDPDKNGLMLKDGKMLSVASEVKLKSGSNNLKIDSSSATIKGSSIKIG